MLLEKESTLFLEKHKFFSVYSFCNFMVCGPTCLYTKIEESEARSDPALQLKTSERYGKYVDIVYIYHCFIMDLSFNFKPQRNSGENECEKNRRPNR